MYYYYFPPFNKQYYFPSVYKKYSLFQSFYQPYTFGGRVGWYCFNNISVLRYMFIEKCPIKILQLDRLYNHISSASILAINRGTKGQDQKTTIVGIDPLTGDEFFLKYAEGEVAKQNVTNEGKILAQLNHHSFVPKLHLLILELNYTLIKTNLLKGERLYKNDVQAPLLEVLLKLARMQLKTERSHYSKELKSCFAHGDLCPWNIIIQDGQLQLFDWEMAGIYPIGYDLFTFIFQTAFHLYPTKKIKQIFKQNEELIKGYFYALKIDDCQPYLYSFANLKFDLESAKQDKYLAKYYQKLKLYAENL